MTQFSPYSRPPAKIDDVAISKDTITVELKDARTLHASIVDLYPVHVAPPKSRKNWEIVADGTAISWPDLDFVVTLEQLFGVK